MATNTTNVSNDRSGEKPSKINDALRVLDEALSAQGANLSNLVTDDFKNLKSAIGALGPRMSESMRDAGTQAYQQVSDIASEGLERGRELYTNVDSTVRANPWPVIGGVAVGTFALGFILGRNAGNATTSYTH